MLIGVLPIASSKNYIAHTDKDDRQRRKLINSDVANVTEKAQQTTNHHQHDGNKAMQTNSLEIVSTYRESNASLKIQTKALSLSEENLSIQVPLELRLKVLNKIQHMMKQHGDLEVVLVKLWGIAK